MEKVAIKTPHPLSFVVFKEFMKSAEFYAWLKPGGRGILLGHPKRGSWGRGGGAGTLKTIQRMRSAKTTV